MASLTYLHLPLSASHETIRTMSSPSPLETADTAQLTSWMSRVVLRPAEPEDREALDKLADLDNAAPLRDPVLLLEEDGRLRAARSLRDGRTISDPFVATEHLRPLLEVHARPARKPGRVREFFRRQNQLWEQHGTGASWGASGGDALRAMRRTRPILDS
jgi:hypothetical protein